MLKHGNKNVIKCHIFSTMGLHSVLTGIDLACM